MKFVPRRKVPVRNDCEYFKNTLYGILDIVHVFNFFIESQNLYFQIMNARFQITRLDIYLYIMRGYPRLEL